MIVSKITIKATGEWAYWRFATEADSGYQEALIDLRKAATIYQAKQVDFNKWENDEVILKCLVIDKDLIPEEDWKRYEKVGMNKYRKLGKKKLGTWKVAIIERRGKEANYEDWIDIIVTDKEEKEDEDYTVYIDNHDPFDDVLNEVLKSYHSEDCDPIGSAQGNKVQEHWKIVTPDGVKLDLYGNFMPTFDGTITVAKAEVLKNDKE